MRSMRDGFLTSIARKKKAQPSASSFFLVEIEVKLISSGGVNTLKLPVFLEWAKPPLRIPVGKPFVFQTFLRRDKSE